MQGSQRTTNNRARDFTIFAPVVGLKSLSRLSQRRPGSYQAFQLKLPRKRLKPP